ncbi:hypothetical protein VP01_2773g2 [Puccinia sorghi]|uniref:Uncharacterized protein n=1 Tax=Puccinia sorghi TaxID=27349 RepID=A0A0L6V2T9_9BASI|nr:hypothetical protein VP01_2773g2 [Puccinia sorghi]
MVHHNPDDLGSNRICRVRTLALALNAGVGTNPASQIQKYFIQSPSQPGIQLERNSKVGPKAVHFSNVLLGLPQLTRFKHQFVPWLAMNQWHPGLLKNTTINTPHRLAQLFLGGCCLILDPLTEALMRSSTNPQAVWSSYRRGGSCGSQQ